MTTKRTKQQIACDGVKVIWSGGDTFTNILQRQVEIQFSMDGIIPLAKKTLSSQTSKVNVTSGIKPAPRQKFTKTIDGIRIPWKQAYAV